jgi:hypothetical protein
MPQKLLKYIHELWAKHRGTRDIVIAALGAALFAGMAALVS